MSSNNKRNENVIDKKKFDSILPSVRFGYKLSRNILHWTGDTGGFGSTLREVTTLLGNIPNEYFPYPTIKDHIDAFDIEPSAFCYFLAQNFKKESIRLDEPQILEEELLNYIKGCIYEKKYPSLDFQIFESISQSSENGEIPYPCENEKCPGYHALTAIGWDDNIKIKNENCDTETIGAILIMNSWGPEWGNNGHGWLPYDYVLNGYVKDCWITLELKNMDISQFKPE